MSHKSVHIETLITPFPVVDKSNFHTAIKLADNVQTVKRRHRTHVIARFPNDKYIDIGRDGRYTPCLIRSNESAVMFKLIALLRCAVIDIY